MISLLIARLSGPTPNVVFMPLSFERLAQDYCWFWAFPQSRTNAKRPLSSERGDGLHAIDGVTVFGPAPDEARTPTLSFVMRGVTSTEVARRLVSSGLYVSNGDFYAATVAQRLGYAEAGLVRIGCACYTTAEEIARLLSALQEIVRG